MEPGSAPSHLNQTTHTAYDAEGRVTQTWGATYPVAYDYDEFGRMISLHTWRDENDFDATSEHGFSNPSYQNADTTQWFYDDATGLLLQKRYADNKGPSCTYTPDGQLITRTWVRGITTDYTYDVAGNLTHIDYSDATPSVTFSYDASAANFPLSPTVSSPTSMPTPSLASLQPKPLSQPTPLPPSPVPTTPLAVPPATRWERPVSRLSMPSLMATTPSVAFLL